MSRYISAFIKKDLKKKAVILSGPRQVGKTTLAKSLFHKSEYLNYDIIQDRKLMISQSWKKDCELVILDELHKFKKWKSLLKGVIDRYQNKPPTIVTGSARLNTFRKAGDALTGRTFFYQLHPIDLSEALMLVPSESPDKQLEHLLQHGGFPESFFNPEDSRRLLMDRLSTVIRDDVRDLSAITSIHSIELLTDLLRERVGGQLSFANLANDIAVSPPTVKSWISILENLYVIFLVRPYSQGIAKSIKKESKCYFFDCSAGMNGDAAKLENLVALSLLKWCDLQRDTQGRRCELRYYRDTSGREVDFVITENSRPYACIEVKTSDSKPSPSLAYLTKRLKTKHAFQLVRNLERETDHEWFKIRSLAKWLTDINSQLS